ncbi:hypothetical protein [Chitinophaga ginsengisoli]|uniref:Uncharacterized protein n=1 Tax=Chitinophaga ginsengisoli TaxID=363837 RepID=A0A2P8G7A6_9BACT|nr:hypothetical protein [Chitinophaga ginsengisoli]PSL29863.1 hypothetical protein CLV42_106198 [Chitinophaga ginsengisoli]
MNEIFQKITSADLRDFAKSLGWQLLPPLVKDGIYLMSNPQYERRQLVFPISSDVSDYPEVIERCVNKLAETSGNTVSAIIARISELKDDALRFRIIDSRGEQQYIPLSYAVTAISGAKELFLSAACSVLKPQYHHPRLSRSEALQLVDRSKFRHTESGSFVLNISSPVNAVEYQGNLFEEVMPFARQTTLAINQGLSKLVTAIQMDTLSELVDEIKSGPKPALSSNFCKAITSFQEEHEGFDLFVDFNWAGILPLPEKMQVNKSIKVQRDYFSRIDDVRKELRNAEQQNRHEDIFMASVEHLAGELGPDGRRAGDVILNLYQEDEIIKARASLTAEQYIQADKAHMTPGAYIKIKGKLNSGNQPRNLSDVIVFELIMI